MGFRPRGWLTAIITYIRRENIPKLTILILMVVGVGAVGLAYFESLSLAQALWWSLVTITTVGYGDIAPATAGGRLVGVVTMLAGIGLLGTVTATIASLMVSMKWEKMHGMRDANCRDHVVLCGWNYKAQEILDDLRSDRAESEIAVVLIADLVEQPVDLPAFFFVRGEINQATMAQANMAFARTAIVLGDERVDAFSRDARTILTTLTIKTAYPHIYTCVELVDPHNVSHCQLARADEIIVSGAMTSGLLVRAALDHGVTHLVSELLSREGHELYLIPVPAALLGCPFLDALRQFKSDCNALIVAVQLPDGRLRTNPESTYQLQRDDHLYVIAEDRPSFSG